MEFVVDFFQSRIGNVRVRLGRRNRRMSQKFLDGPDVRAVSKQRGRERMPKRMGRNVFYDAGLERALGNGGRDEVAGQSNVLGFEGDFPRVSHARGLRFVEFVIHGIPAFVFRIPKGSRSVVMPDEERFEIVVTDFEIIGNSFRGAFRQIYDAHFAAFSTDGELPSFEIDPISIKPGKFGYAQSGRIDAFENREIPLVLNFWSRTSVKETFNFFHFQKRHASVTAFGKFDRRGIN